MFHLVRFALSDQLTLGRLDCDGKLFWTVEKPWKNNEPFVSCIPAGDYEMVRRDSPKFGPNTWEVANVPGRSHILLHVGNYARDVVGCIAVGQTLRQDWQGVGSSRLAMQELQEITQGVEASKIRIEETALRDIFALH